MGEIRFVGTGETRGYPYLVCKNILSTTRFFADDPLAYRVIHYKAD